MDVAVAAFNLPPAGPPGRADSAGWLYTYYAHSAGGSTVYPAASQTVYSDTSGGGARTTGFGYTWQSGSVQLASETITSPPIATGQNGPASSNTDTAHADTSTTFFDAVGYLRLRIGWRVPITHGPMLT
ncbi:MAG TPA: hypothetical protein VIM11_04780 [Tepidisphaeraceae bacterium]|jgi:hypothetical protein